MGEWLPHTISFSIEPTGTPALVASCDSARLWSSRSIAVKFFFGSDGAQKGRDGCRVPIPWDREPPGFGFSERTPWLPIPQTWAPVSVPISE